MPTLRTLLPVASLLLILALAASASAGGAPKLHDSVTYAPTWEAAVEEAKLLNVPIVVHSHGFYCPPCWGMHSSLLQNKKYIKFADENTVEVIVLGRLSEGIAENHKKAEEYETEIGGEKVNCMVEFPGLTRDQMLALGKSKAARYNETGSIPYTCIVDPHTLEELHAWSGRQSAKSVMEEIETRVKALHKTHGDGISRKALRKIADAELAAREESKDGTFDKAIKILDKAAKGADEWPEALQKRLADARAQVVAAAGASVDAAAALSESNPKEARRRLSRLKNRVRGTGLEDRVKEFLAALSAKRSS